LTGGGTNKRKNRGEEEGGSYGVRKGDMIEYSTVLGVNDR